MTRKVYTSQFFGRNLEMAEANLKRMECEEGVINVNGPYAVEYKGESDWPMWEHQWRMASEKEKREIWARKAKEDEAKGIYHPFTSL